MVVEWMVPTPDGKDKATPAPGVCSATPGRVLTLDGRCSAALQFQANFRSSLEYVADTPGVGALCVILMCRHAPHKLA